MSQDIDLAVRLRPGVRPLTGVFSVLHARAANVAALQYEAHARGACLTIRCSMTAGDADLLARQIERRIDVLSASVEQRPERSASAAVDPWG